MTPCDALATPGGGQDLLVGIQWSGHNIHEYTVTHTFPQNKAPQSSWYSHAGILPCPRFVCQLVTDHFIHLIISHCAQCFTVL